MKIFRQTQGCLLSSKYKTVPKITTPAPILPRSNQFTVPAGAGGGPGGAPSVTGGVFVVLVAPVGVVVPDVAAVGALVV